MNVARTIAVLAACSVLGACASGWPRARTAGGRPVKMIGVHSFKHASGRTASAPGKAAHTSGKAVGTSGKAGGDVATWQLHYNDGSKMNLMAVPVGDTGVVLDLNASGTGSGVNLSEGGAYVSGSFSAAAMASWWPVVVTRYIGIGAEGTDLIVQATVPGKPDTQRVFLIGPAATSKVRVYWFDGTQWTSIAVLSGTERYAEIALTVGPDDVATDATVSVAGPVPAQAAADDGDPRYFYDRVKQEAQDIGINSPPADVYN